MTKPVCQALGAGLVLAGIGLAHADSNTVAGAWILTVGVDDAPCTLTLTADENGSAGQVNSGENCPTGLSTMQTWKAAGGGIQFYRGGDDLIAWLNPKGDAFVGTRFTDGKKLALKR